MRRVPRSPHGPVAIASSPWIVVGAGVVVMVVLLFVALGTYRGAARHRMARRCRRRCRCRRW
ncbi:hypothetical protein NKG94_48900 [Micromonospora sp. M12]